jgi:hypothetical protein
VSLVLDVPDGVGHVDRHPTDGIEDLRRHGGYFTYCDGSASNFFLQIGAQK